MRIIVVVFVLVGGTAFFGYWSIDQLDRELDSLGAAYLANTTQVFSYLKQKSEVASSSPETSGSLETSTSTKLAFTFPQEDTMVYIGCTYPVSWQSSTTVSSLEASLIDAGTREAVGPNTAGLAKENAVEKGSQSLDWKVGVVWPGIYHIEISEINGVSVETRSKAFSISKMPVNIDPDEQKSVCQKSGGSY